MKSMQPGARHPFCGGALLMSALLAHAAACAASAVDEQRAVDPRGTVKLVMMSGSLEVRGWEKPELAVTGTLGTGVERVEINVAGDTATVRAVPQAGMHLGWGADTHLVIHVPEHSAVTASAVSADVTVADIQGYARLTTLSGNLSGDVGGDLYAKAVSGDIKLSAPGATSVDVESISGTIEIAGAGGDVEVRSISGDVHLQLGTVKRGHFKSISGNVTATLALDAAGRIDGESVSGDLDLSFARVPDGDIDVQTYSGDIRNCFGPKPVEPRYGPGSRLEFRQGSGGARIQIETKSGNVRLCAKDLHGA